MSVERTPVNANGRFWGWRNPEARPFTFTTDEIARLDVPEIIVRRPIPVNNAPLSEEEDRAGAWYQFGAPDPIVNGRPWGCAGLKCDAAPGSHAVSCRTICEIAESHDVLLTDHGAFGVVLVIATHPPGGRWEWEMHLRAVDIKETA